MTWAVLLGISSGLCWGTADFFGGLQSRHVPVVLVALWSQLLGAPALLAVTLLSGQPLPLAGFAWGGLAGLCGGLAVVLFYRALSIGLMSIVAPVSACGVVVPVLFELALGGRPGPLVALGILAALGGIVLVSLQQQESPQTVAPRRLRPALALALSAALGYGLYYIFFDRGITLSHAAPLWVSLGTRCGSLLMLLLIIIVRRRPIRWPGGQLGPVAAIGALDTAASACFAYASVHGNLSLVAVLSSLYPIATVLLGRIVLAERLSYLQHAGVALALGGAVLLSAG